MKQSINFLKTLPKKTNRIPASIILWTVLITFILLIICIIVLWRINHQGKTNLEQEEKERQTLQQEYDLLAKKNPLLISSLPLEQQIRDLEGSLEAKKQELSFLEHVVSRHGYSEYMFDLAQVTPKSLWLNGIHIDHDPEDVTLYGYVIHPDAVSELMSRLMTSPAFKDWVFQSFYVKALKKHSYLKFAIATNSLNNIELQDEKDKEEQNTSKAKE